MEEESAPLPPEKPGGAINRAASSIEAYEDDGPPKDGLPPYDLAMSKLLLPAHDCCWLAAAPKLALHSPDAELGPAPLLAEAGSA